MALPTLTPTSTNSAIVLPSSVPLGEAELTYTHVNDACAIGVYAESLDFVTGAAAQVAYTYKKLGGDILDIEITSGSVYANYEEACLEYSYILNLHQAKNMLGSALGGSTGSFDHQGAIKSGDALEGANVALKYPKFSFETAFRLGESFGTEAMVGGQQTIYSASFDTVSNKQDYDLQQIVETAAADDSMPFYNKIDNKRIKIRQVYYVTPRQMWRFYGYYGGLNVTGDAHSYGQYSDDTTFQVIPVWQNKMQAIQYEDHLYTRTSHYSYEVVNNQLRLYPTPADQSPEKFWFRFSVASGEIWEDDYESGQHGINNMNTLPFENIPYANINAIGKQWIRRFALALSKETLGQVRGKFGGNIPIPGDNVTLNASDLLSQAATEQKDLREELKTILAEMTYDKLIETDKNMTENAKDIIQDVPLKIFVG